MKIAGEATLVAPVEKVWDAILDPQVLVRTIPGCERLEEVGEHSYAMTVTAGVAAVRGTYDGTCRLHDLTPHESLVLSAQGAGAPGTISAEVDVRFEANDDGTTTLRYDADATVGGMVGGVGQRMLTSVSRRMATEFFHNIEGALAPGVPGVEPAAEERPAGEPAAAGEPAPSTGGAVFTRPSAPAAGGDRFLEGILVGAGLVLVGAVVGGLLGRRR